MPCCIPPVLQKNTPVNNISGNGNKLTFTANDNEISTENLHKLAKKFGNPGIDLKYAERSYRSFAISGDELKSMAYGYVYSKQTKGSIGDEKAIAFSAGNLTALDDAIFKTPPSGIINYQGGAFIGTREDIVRGSSIFNVNFAKNEITGALKFKNGSRLDSGWGQETQFPELVEFDNGQISGNTFTASGEAKHSNRPSANAQGQFYGAGAAELGGIFTIDDVGLTRGSFGAIKQ